ncbi:MAG: hypothetical protein C5B51_05265 [Terriglobia bacterium]|nr:MAG: hypothetical protein C5B51_05265 [Terriglobia bacterium]
MPHPAFAAVQELEAEHGRDGFLTDHETGDMLEFSVAPAFYQTYWFLAACTAAFGALLWAAYEFRTRQLQRDFQKLRGMIETIPAMAWTALPDGSNEFSNRRWAEFTGLSAEETAGFGWTAALHPDDLHSFSEKWRGSVATGEPLEAEARFRYAASGDYRWLHARGVPLRDTAGKIRRWDGILTDIEDRKRSEHERERCGCSGRDASNGKRAARVRLKSDRPGP